MKNILKIFFADIKGLIKNPFALVIALGLCFLPSLYAWFNIYSNWDPYSNTGNIKIAIYSEDKGITTDKGDYKNIGKEVVDELKSNKKIGWTNVKSREEAESGVESGKYYAAVVICSKFTDALYNGALTDFKDNPTITYYENEKKNAVATKITDSAVDSLKKNINEKFLNVVIKSAFEQTNSLAGNIEHGKDVNIKDKINALSNSLTQYSDIIDSLIKSNSSLEAAMQSAQHDANGMSSSISNSANAFNDTNKKLNEAEASVKDFNNNINNTLNQIKSSLNSISDEIKKAQLSESATDLNTQISNILKNTSSVNSQISSLKQTLSNTKDASLNSLQKSIGDNVSPEIKNDIESIKNTYEKPIETIDFINNNLNKIDSELKIISSDKVSSITDEVRKSLNNCTNSISSINTTYSNTLVPQLKSVTNNISDALTSATNMLNTLSGSAQSMGQVFGNVNTTMSTTNNTLKEIKTAVDDINKRIKDFETKFKNATTEEFMNNLINFMKGDSEEYGNYLASPVSIKTEKIYPVASYGSAMTPFYSVLAIWVGITILVSIIKVHAEPKNLIDVKPYQLYFGRLLIFLLLSAVQTIIIVLGNIYLLKCQILYPGLFTIAALATSFTFTLLIYSLTISFGDIGKAFAVIIMVIQIAGSSGTFPIELLPNMYQKIYIFFPFPYAINAMRETIGGIYGMTYIKSLSELLIFAVVALLIGLVIRIPFIHINHYMEKRMEDTKMM